MACHLRLGGIRFGQMVGASLKAATVSQLSKNFLSSNNLKLQGLISRRTVTNFAPAFTVEVEVGSAIPPTLQFSNTAKNVFQKGEIVVIKKSSGEHVYAKVQEKLETDNLIDIAEYVLVLDENDSSKTVTVPVHSLGKIFGNVDNPLSPTVDKELPPALPSIPNEAYVSYLASIQSPDTFWAQAAQAFHWETNFPTVRRKDKLSPVWFYNGRINLTYNCVDRHVVNGNGAHVAFILEPARPGGPAPSLVTFQKLHKLVTKAAKVLRDLGVRRGDRVAILLPARLELPVAMLACARIGAVHATLSPRLGTEALAARLADLRPDVLITLSSKSSSSPVWRIASDALAAARAGVSKAAAARIAPRGLLVNPVRRPFTQPIEEEDAESMEAEGTVWADWEARLARAEDSLPVEWVNAEDPAYVVFPDAVAGAAAAASPVELAAGARPLGMLYPAGGALVGAATGFRQVMAEEEGRNEVFWYAAPDVGAVEAAYLAYGPTAWGRTQLLVEEGAEEIEGAVGGEAGKAGCCGVCGGCIGVGARVWELVEKHHVGRILVPSAQARRWRVAEEELSQSAAVAASARGGGSKGDRGPTAAPVPPLRWRYSLGSLRRVVTYGEAPDAETWQWLRTVVAGLGTVPEPARRGAAMVRAGAAGMRNAQPVSVGAAWGCAEAGGFLLASGPEGSPVAGPAMRPLDGVEAVLLRSGAGDEVGGPGEGFLAVRGAGRPGRATGPLRPERDALRFEAATAALAGAHGGWVVPPPSELDGAVGSRGQAMLITREVCRRGVGGGLAPAGRVGQEAAWINGRWQDVAEIERALASHPAVLEVAVTSFPHPRRGHGICAFVALRSDKESAASAWGNTGLTETPDVPSLGLDIREQLRLAVVRRVGRFASPDFIIHVAKLPRSREGYLQRQRLRTAAQEAAAAADNSLDDVESRISKLARA